MLTTRKKKIIVNEHAVHEKDTGSSAVQVALLTRQISELTGHLKRNPKDNSSRRGLLQMVGKRRRLLHYLEKHDPTARKDIVKKLEL